MGAIVWLFKNAARFATSASKNKCWHLRTASLLLRVPFGTCHIDWIRLLTWRFSRLRLQDRQVYSKRLLSLWLGKRWVICIFVFQPFPESSQSQLEWTKTKCVLLRKPCLRKYHATDASCNDYLLSLGGTSYRILWMLPSMTKKEEVWVLILYLRIFHERRNKKYASWHQYL